MKASSTSLGHVRVNRAPVLTLWASVVARCLGFKREEALPIGRAVARLNAYTKGKSLGLCPAEPETVSGEHRQLEARCCMWGCSIEPSPSYMRQFRPRIPYGIRGWRAAGELDIERIYQSGGAS
jgi:hypothetical protein